MTFTYKRAQRVINRNLRENYSHEHFLRELLENKLLTTKWTGETLTEGLKRSIKLIVTKRSKLKEVWGWGDGL